MTNIKIDRRDSHFVIEISGHANYAPKGQDIVCSGISLLSFMINNVITQEARVITCIMEDGYCYFAFVTEEETTKAKIDMIASGFRMLSDVYPQYVSLSLTSDGRYIDTSERR